MLVVRHSTTAQTSPTIRHLLSFMDSLHPDSRGKDILAPQPFGSPAILGPSCSEAQLCKKEARTRSFVSLGFPSFTLVEVAKTLLLREADVQKLG
jgi:hypothetical protein